MLSDWTSLMYASHGGHIKIVEMFLNAGANIEAKDNE